MTGLVKLTWCWSNTLWNGVDKTSDVGQQRNDACSPFGGLNYSTVTLSMLPVTKVYSGTQIHVGRPWALCPWLTWGKWRSHLWSSCFLELTPDSSGLASGCFGIAGGPWVVGICLWWLAVRVKSPKLNCFGIASIREKRKCHVSCLGLTEISGRRCM